MLLAGCASQSGGGTHAGETYIVKAQQSLFYLYGPAQVSGPDFALSKGQQVTMLERQYGFSHISVQPTGVTGYVSTDDLAPAPPPAAQPSPAPGAGRHRRHPAWYRPQAPAQGSQIPLPEFPDTLPPPDAPPFRF